VSTAPALTAPSLLQIVRAHRLVETERLDAFVKTLPKETLDAPDPKRLAESLVGARLLTKFQAALLLQGKSRSLTIAGKYRLIDRLGAGGMGLVYLCEHLKMRRPVAVKVLPQKQATEPGQLDRFLREAQAAAAMKHPNIVQAHDIDSDNGVHYLVMEYVDGADLDRLVNTIGPLEPTRAAYYIAQAAAGLQHAAERGLVHRDIKPSNLLVDREGVIKVLDLGLARLAGHGSLTERFDSHSVLGTADYISPEQALNSHDVDTRADIYSLGCTFYFLLAGRAPFKDANVTQKLLMHQVTEPTPIDEIRGDVPPGMPEVLEKMMAKDPAARFQSPAEVLEALAEWTDPPPPPPTEAELPPPALGTSSPSDSSVSGRGQVTLTLPKAGLRTGVTGALTTRRPIRGASATEAPPSSKKKWAIWGGVAALGVVVIGLAAWHPWSGPSNPDDWQDSLVKNRPVATPPPQNRPPAPARPARGFGYLLLDPGMGRPLVVNGDIRETPTDLLYVNTSDLAKSLAGDTDFTPVFNRDAIGRGAVRVVPYAVVQTASNYANTFLAVDLSGPRSLVAADCVTADRIAGASSERIAMLRGSVIFKPGLTELNSLITDLSDVGAGTGGSTVKLYSGAILFSGSPREQNTSLGAGSNPLTLDFVGHTGYVTLASDQDFAVKGRATREHFVRARLTGFGESPLVLSGMWGTALGLDASENEASRLVVQGITLIGGSSADKVFRVSFIDDRELGRPQGSVTLIDANLNYRGESSVDIDRPLSLVRTGRLSATERAKGPKVTLRWAGKISGGGRLVKVGNAPVSLTNGQNDYSGGTEVSAGVLVLGSVNGTPVGPGGVVVNNGATLTGTAKIPGGVTVKPGGNLQPGTDAGGPLRLSGLSLQKGKIAGREGDVTAAFTARPTGAGDGKLLIYEGTGTLDLGSASLKITPANSFKPTEETRVFLIVNSKAPAVRGTFQNLEGGARVVTTDGKWTARISYQGDAKSGVAAGGKDVMLYDWAPAGK